MHELWPWLRLLSRRRLRLSVGLLLLFLTLLFGVGLLALSGWFITATAVTGLLIAGGTAASINLYVPGGGIRFFAVGRTVVRYIERLYNHDTVLRLLSDVRVALFERLSAASLAHRESLRGSQWLSRLTNDVDTLDTLYLRLVAPTLVALCMFLLLVLGTGWVFDMQAALGVGALLALTFMLATFAVYRHTAARTAAETDRREALRTEVVAHLEGLAELTAAGFSARSSAQLLDESFGLTRDQSVVAIRLGWYQALIQALLSGAVVFALWSGFSLLAAEAISAPVLVLLPLALLAANEAYAALPDAFGRLGGAVAAARRLSRDGGGASVGRDGEAGAASGLNTFSAPADPALTLEARGITLQYPGQLPALEGFSLQLGRCEHLGVIGPSGCGKSSLADAVAGLLSPVRGDILRVPAAVLTQRTVLFEDTLRANLLLGNPQARDEQLWQVLAVVALEQRFREEAVGLDTWVGTQGRLLSGGEARRVALARVLLSDAPLLVLDEPFTGVDAPTRELIGDRMGPLLAERAVLAFAHEAEALPRMHRIYTLGAQAG
jgi:ATP-binding cassette subfamily C protein CydC